MTGFSDGSPRDSTVEFVYSSRQFTFQCWPEPDHLLRSMRRHGTFYEIDVLETVRERLQAGGRSGAAIDAGAFIGTHSVYFAAVCHLAPVFAFEVHPGSFRLLKENVRANGVNQAVIAVPRALSIYDGFGTLVEGEDANKGLSRIDLSAHAEGRSIEAISVDSYIEHYKGVDVALIKVDVEGTELDVLRGAVRTLLYHQPIICIEAHTSNKLKDIVHFLMQLNYVIFDCRGWSPTYIFERSNVGSRTCRFVASIWVARAKLPTKYRRSRELLRRLAKRLALMCL